MSDIWGAPWSNNPNAPRILNWLHNWEKAYFTGSLRGAILYGIVIILFFQCMSALLDPVNRTKGEINWKFMAHTAAMFSFATIYIAMNLNIQSISFVDNREFPGITTSDVLPPGPVGYQWFLRSKPIGVATTPMIVLNNWLANGLLLYRCHIVYAMNYWIIAFPCIMYLTCFALNYGVVDFAIPYFSISFSLNVLLTLMIITRLVMHRNNIRNAMGAAAGVGGFYVTALTIFIKSSVLYAVSFLLYVGTLDAESPLEYPFMQILVQTQVIAQFLITLRVTNRRSLMNDSIVSGDVGSIRFSSQGKLPDNREIPPSGFLKNSMDGGEFGIRVETTIDLHQDRTVSGSEGSFKT